MQVVQVRILNAHRCTDDDGSLIESLNEAYGFENGDIVDAEVINGVYFVGFNAESYLRDDEFEVVE